MEKYGLNILLDKKISNLLFNNYKLSLTLTTAAALIIFCVCAWECINKYVSLTLIIFLVVTAILVTLSFYCCTRTKYKKFLIVRRGSKYYINIQSEENENLQSIISSKNEDEINKLIAKLKLKQSDKLIFESVNNKLIEVSYKIMKKNGNFELTDIHKEVKISIFKKKFLNWLFNTNYKKSDLGSSFMAMLKS